MVGVAAPDAVLSALWASRTTQKVGWSDAEEKVGKGLFILISLSIKRRAFIVDEIATGLPLSTP